MRKPAKRKTRTTYERAEADAVAYLRRIGGWADETCVEFLVRRDYMAAGYCRGFAAARRDLRQRGAKRCR